MQILTVEPEGHGWCRAWKCQLGVLPGHGLVIELDFRSQAPNTVCTRRKAEVWLWFGPDTTSQIPHRGDLSPFGTTQLAQLFSEDL